MTSQLVSLGPPLKAMPDLKAGSKLRVEENQMKQTPESFATVLKKSESPVLSGYATPPGKAEAPKIQGQVRSDTNDRVENLEDVEVKSLQPMPGMKDLTPRQQVMRKFMDSMESEFGVAPEEVVGAMAKLSDEDLLKSPEENATEIIDKLEVDEQDQERALALYMSMVGQLSALKSQSRDVQPMSADAKAFVKNAIQGESQVPMQKSDQQQLSTQQKLGLAAAAGAGGAAVTAQTMSAKEKRQLLNDSLDKMSTRFFVKPEMRLPTEIPAMANMKSAETLSIKDRPTLEQMSIQAPAGLQAKGMANEDLRKALLDVSASAAAIGESLRSDSQNEVALRAEDQLSGADEIIMGEDDGVGSVGLAGLATTVAQIKSNPQMSEGGGRSGGESFSKDSDKAPAQKLNARVNESLPMNFSQQLQSLKPDLRTLPVMGGAATMATQSSQATGEMNEANVQALIKQAQYLVKKGGGEASVQMSPEGMGQVHLKIIINEGKVNLEMKAESAETKKLLESNLNDLKSTLNTHRLAVDHVKVDVGNQLSTGQDNPQRSLDQNANFQQHQQREQARAFFNQFHEDNLSRRDGFYETTGVKAYSKSKPVQALQPADEQVSAKSRRDLGRGRGSGLDLVA